MTKAGGGNGERFRIAEMAAVLALLVLLVLLFFPGAFSGGSFYFRDLFRVHYPAKTFGLQCVLEAGELPWWNPRLSCGQPFLADPNFTVFYPTNLLYLLLPFSVAFNLHILIHYFIGSLFTYLLARRLRLAPPAALVAALALAYGGFSLSLGNFYNAAASAAYTPLLLLLLLASSEPGEAGRRSPRTVLFAAVAGLALALQFIGGEPVYLLLTGGLVFLAGCTGILGRRLSVSRVLVFWIVSAGLAAALAAVQLLPALDLVGLSGRGAGFTLNQAARHSVHPFRLLEMLFPGLFGNPLALSHWGFWGHHWFDGNFPYIISIYCGVGVLLLALFAPALGGRRGLVIALWCGTIVCLLLALGRHGPLFPIFHALTPGAGLIRYPVKFLQPLTLCLALLAGLGLQGLTGGERGRAGRGSPRALGWCFAASALALGSVGLLLRLGLLDLSALFETPLTGAAVPATQLPAALAGMAGALTRSVLAAAAFTALFAITLMLPLRWRSLAGWLIAAAVALDLLGALAGINPVAPVDFYHPPAGPLETIQKLEGGTESRTPFRLYHDSGKDLPSVTLEAPADDRLWHFHWMRLMLFPQTAPLEYAFDPDWDGMYLTPVVQAGNLARGWPAADRAAILGLFNVRYVMAFRPQEDRRLEELGRWKAGSNLTARLYRNQAEMPRAYWVPEGVRCTSEEDLVRRLQNWLFDPRRQCLLLAGDGPVTDQEKLAHPFTSADAQCRITTREQLRVAVELDCPAAGYLVLGEAHAAGWQAELDGAPVPIRRANLALRSVAVPAGRHLVLFSYRPRWRTAAPLISLGGLLAALSLILIPLVSSALRSRAEGPGRQPK